MLWGKVHGMIVQYVHKTWSPPFTPLVSRLGFTCWVPGSCWPHSQMVAADWTTVMNRAPNLHPCKCWPISCHHLSDLWVLLRTSWDPMGAAKYANQGCKGWWPCLMYISHDSQNSIRLFQCYSLYHTALMGILYNHRVYEYLQILTVSGQRSCCVHIT